MNHAETASSVRSSNGNFRMGVPVVPATNEAARLTETFDVLYAEGPARSTQIRQSRPGSSAAVRQRPADKISSDNIS
jgi:hypothetical protein